MRRKHIGVSFFIFHLEIALGGIRPKAPWVHTHHVNGGFTINNPFRKLPARTASRRHTEGMAFIKPEIFLVPSRPNNRGAIGRISNSAIVNLLDAHFAKGWNPRDGGFNIRA